MRVHRRVGLSGAGIAVTFSLLGHAGVALFAAHHHRGMATGSVTTVQAALPVSDADFVTAEDDDTAPPPAHSVAAVEPANAAPRAVLAHSVMPAVAPSTSTTSAPVASAAAEPASAAPSVAQDSSGPHFAMTVAPTVGSATGVATSGAVSSGSGVVAGGSGAGPIAAINADIPAKLRAGNVPAYTAAALSAGVEANVPLEIVVSEAGVVVSARVLEHVGYGLDEAARQGVLEYRFTPAVRSGKATAVRMQWLMRFQLR